MTARATRFAVVAALLAAVSGVSIFVVMRGRGGERGMEVGPGPGTGPRLEIGPNRLVGYSPSGEVLFEAQMEGGEYDKEHESARLWGVKCSMMEQGAAVSAVESDRMDFFLKQNKALFGGAVRVWSEKQGVEIRCEDLAWDIGQKVLHSDKPAQFQWREVKMQGNRVDADLTLRRVSLYDGARLVAEVKLPRR